ncbi:MAG TPA: phage minor head protein [Myxococcales bacterium]|nr:phage minor head protein [Myxococcales bacterium]
MKFEAAIGWFKARVPLTDEELAALEQEAAELAFYVTGATQLDVVTAVWNALESSIDQGTPFADFQEAVADVLEDAWGGEIPGRLETIFRTNLQTSYSAGRYREQYSPAARRQRPYVRLDTVPDSRESDICEALNGLGAFPKDGAFIASHHPPLHFSCRTQEVDLTEEEAQELGLEASPPDVAADDGFGGTPGFGWKPDLSHYPPELRQVAEERLR